MKVNAPCFRWNVLIVVEKKHILRKNLATHRQKCKLELVSCRRWNLGCIEKVKRQEMQKHLQSKCALRLVKCKHCGVETAVKVYSKHTQDCMEFPVHCSNGCKVRGIIRKDLNNHRQTCKYELMQCCHVSGGCNVKVKRCDMKDHLTKKCKLTKTECPYCGTSYAQNRYFCHEKLCEALPRTCPNKCGQQRLVRSTLKSHIRVCPLEEVQCKDCNEIIKWENMQNHLDNQCQYREMTCEDCGASLAVKNYLKHEDECP